MLSLYYYLYNRVLANSSKDKPIWVSKPKPTLPLGLGPPPTPLTPEDFEETTYFLHEKKLLMEAAQAIVASGVISIFMSRQFKVHVSCLIQSIMAPLNAIDSPLIKKYIFGMKKNSDGTNIYGEFVTRPTLEAIAIAERLKNGPNEGNQAPIPPATTEKASTAAAPSNVTPCTVYHVK